MPIYDIEHLTPLSPSQQEQLAKAFTHAHALRFGTPSYFINVRYTDVSQQVVYRGGVLRRYNRAILRTRAGSTRPIELFNEHCRALVTEWEKIVGTGKGDDGEDRGLRTVWILGALTTALEGGFVRPQTGQEKSWLREHKAEFQRLADEGDEEMKGLMKELERREDFRDV